MIADLIHSLSKRSDNGMVKVNCSTVPTELAEAHFFGSVRGSYTGSREDTTGYFREADKGTIFLDELPEMPYNVQTKLLRALQAQRFRPIGGKTDTSSDFRIIWASNIPVQDAIRDRKLREDLYFRIAEAKISIPPLRERGADIAPLSRFFLQQAATEFEKNVKGFSNDVLRLFEDYNWPGNVRQLRAVVRNAVIMCEGNTIGQDDINMEANDYPKLSLLEDVERRHIEKILRLEGGSRVNAAKQLGIGRQTLYNKVKTYGIELSPSPMGRRSAKNNGHVSPSAMVVFSKKMTAEQIFAGHGDLEFDWIKSEKEYVKLNQMISDAILDSGKNPGKIARYLKTSVERLKQVISVFQIDQNLNGSLFSSDNSGPKKLRRDGRPDEAIIDAEIVEG